MPTDPETAKRAVSPSANSFWINTAAGRLGGKGSAINFMRNSGSNDAGTAHETWRMVNNRKVDNIDQNTGAGGYGVINGSDGAADYVIGFDNAGGDIPGGSYHGGETLTGPQIWTCDGVPFDPTVDTPTGVEFVLTRQSRIATAVLPGIYADVNYALRIRKNDTVRQEFTITPSPTPVELSATSGSITLGMNEARYTQVWTEDGATLLHTFTTFGTEFDLPISQAGGYRLVDPQTGDWTIIRWTVTGRTPSRVYVRHESFFSKLYIKTGAGTLSSPYTVTQEKQFFSPNPPTITAPYTDSLNGPALGPLWRRIVEGTATSVTVSGGTWRIVGGAGNPRTVFVMPINPTDGPGNYQVQIDYFTDTATTSGNAGIARSDTTSTANPLVAAVNFNSVAPTTLTINFAIAAGETPWLKVQSSDQNGRAVNITEVRIVKLA